MNPHPTTHNLTSELARAVARLNDVCIALRSNSCIEEAEIVSAHLEQLSSPEFESRIRDMGIDAILLELSQVFVSGTNSLQDNNLP